MEPRAKRTCGGYDFGPPAFNGFTPYEYTCSIWTKEPQRFKLNPTHIHLGPNITLLSKSNNKKDLTLSQGFDSVISYLAKRVLGRQWKGAVWA